MLDDLLRGNGAYAPAGYGMAALIAVRLGEARLRAVGHGDPSAFVAAYQEAATHPGSQPVAGRPWVVATDLDALPAFPAPLYRSLMALLAPAR